MPHTWFMPCMRLAVLIGFTTAATIVGSFVCAFPPIVAVIMNYARRSATRGTFLGISLSVADSHLLVRCALGCVSSGRWSLPLMIVLIGFPLFFVSFGALAIWIIYRVGAAGWLCATADRCTHEKYYVDFHCLRRYRRSRMWPEGPLYLPDKNASVVTRPAGSAPQPSSSPTSQAPSPKQPQDKNDGRFSVDESDAAKLSAAASGCVHRALWSRQVCTNPLSAFAAPLSGNTVVSSARAGMSRCSSITPLTTDRRSNVGIRSRP